MPTPVFSIFGPKPQFEDLNGNPMVGGKLYFRAGGTSTPKGTYTDSTGSVANPNPVVLNARGEPPDEIWGTTGPYRIICEDALGNVLWTVNNFTPINDVSISASEWQSSGLTPSFINATSFQVPGNQTNVLQPRRRIQTLNSGGTIYSTILTSVFATGVTTVTVRNDSGVLDSGLSLLLYGFLSATNPSQPLESDATFKIAKASTLSILATVVLTALTASHAYSFPDYDARIGNLVPGIGPLPYCGRAIPAGWLDCNQPAVSRVTYATLFEQIVPLIGTFTVTIASPGVFTLNGHGFAAGNPIYLTTTGALPTGLSANVIYFVASAGLTANNFQLSLVPGGASINTSGGQSGTHSIRSCPFGLGDGSSTFDLPKTAGRGVIGEGSGTAFETLTNTAINTGTDSVTVQQNTDRWQTGMLITWGVTGTPPTTSPANLLDNGDTVYVIRVDATTVRFATTLANAQNGVVIDITATGTGTFTMTKAFAARQAGQDGGDDDHAMTSTELLSHFHGANIVSPGGSPVASAAGSGSASPINTTSTGGNAAMSVRNPYLVTKMIISY